MRVSPSNYLQKMKKTKATTSKVATIHKTTFEVSQMDCPSEENMIRLKLGDFEGILQLDFDIAGRTLTVIHSSPRQEIQQALASLKLGDKFIETEVLESFEASEDQTQRKLLITVLLINLIFFIVEMTTGLISGSMGLVSDSLDMLADAMVYGLSLLAIGKSLIQKKRVAKLAGYFQIILALGGIIEVVRRFIYEEGMPHFSTMIIISTLALIANGICLYLLQKSKSTEAHMRASMIFTSNDIIINLGVIVAGTLVYYLKSGIPDLVVGTVVFIVVLRGAQRILKLGA